MSNKKVGTIKESTVNAFDLQAGKSENAGVGVSIPKDVWENFLTEIQARKIKVSIEADGPQITSITVEDR